MGARSTLTLVPFADRSKLGRRGFCDCPLLVVLDGAQGRRAAVRAVCGDVPVPRGQWHTRESDAEATRALDRLHRELRLLNASA